MGGIKDNTCGRCLRRREQRGTRKKIMRREAGGGSGGAAEASLMQIAARSSALRCELVMIKRAPTAPPHVTCRGAIWCRAQSAESFPVGASFGLQVPRVTQVSRNLTWPSNIRCPRQFLRRARYSLQQSHVMRLASSE